MEKEKKIKQIKLTIILVISIIVVPALIVGIVGLKQDLDKKKQIAAEEAKLAAQIEVPDVKGMTINEARETLNNVGLEINLTDYDKRQTESNPNEYVVESQYPSAKEKVDKNTEVKLFFKELKVVESNNFYGMRFKKTISEFCEDYNKAIETINTQQGKDTYGVEAAKSLESIKASDFSYNQTDTETTVKQYSAKKLSHYIGLFTELDSDYIVYACVGYNNSGAYNEESAYLHKIGTVYPAIIMALTDCTYKSSCNIVESMLEQENTRLFKDNVAYMGNSNKYGDYLYATAISEDKYNEIYNKNNTKITSENNTETNEDIKNAISSVNSEFGLDFEPTAEQLKEIQEFYDIKNPTGDFYNDTLLQFLIQKGWVEMGEDNSSNNNSSTNSSSSSNKSNSTNKNTNTNTENKIQPYINVLVYPLTYFSDEERERICQNNESVKITIKYNGKTIKSSTYKYSDNKDGIVELNNLKVDTNEGKLTVEVNDKVVPDSNGNKNVDVSIYQLDNELKDNMFTFINTSNMMG